MKIAIILWIYSLFWMISITQCATKSNFSGSQSNLTHSNSTDHHEEYIKVVDWKFHELKNFIIFSLFIVIVVIMKIIYFHLPKIPSLIPESCVLVIIGVLFGVIIKYSIDEQHSAYFKLTPPLFFFVLLPPIVLESAYSLYHKNFLDNLLSILVFAVFGTLLNFVIIGLSLWGLAQFGQLKQLNINLKHTLLFSSLIVAVDPVAVLAIFKEVGVNQDLYYLVFGESLLNDAVTVVLYEMMQEFALMKTISATNIILGIVSFFTISFGAMIIGLIIGMLGCITIRFMTNADTEILEPILLISSGYMAYLVADVFAWSGILSMTVCGVVQAAYALYGITDKSRVALKRFVKIIASVCEALIFLFLGVELVIGKLQWHTAFSLSSLVLCLVVRFGVTFALSGIINKIHMSIRNIPLREKVIISYGGLRGAVAFSLAVLLKEKAFENSLLTKEIILTTTLFIILFTIIIQGISIKPFVKLLNIAKMDKKETRLSLFDELNESLIDASENGVSAILGKCGRNYIFMVLENFSKAYLRPILQKSDSSYAKMASINEKINSALIANLNDHHTYIAGSANFHQLPNSYKNLLSVLNSKKDQPKPKVEIRQNPIYMHSMSDTTGDHPMHGQPIKRLKHYLFRASQISDDNFDPWEVERRVKSVFVNTNSVVKAKNKFLKLRKPKSDSPEKQENIALVPTNDEQDSELNLNLKSEPSDIDKIVEVDESKFY